MIIKKKEKNWFVWMHNAIEWAIIIATVDCMDQLVFVN